MATSWPALVLSLLLMVILTDAQMSFDASFLPVPVSHGATMNHVIRSAITDRTDRCMIVTSKEACEANARKRGFSDTTAAPADSMDVPPGCYIVPTYGRNHQLYFNSKIIGNTKACTGFRRCVCKNGVKTTERPLAPTSMLKCENSDLTIQCGHPGEAIRVKHAIYGRMDRNTCPHASMGRWNGNCRASTSLQKVKASCERKNSCKIGVNNGVFGDPCPGVYKYLNVDYECVPCTDWNHSSNSDGPQCQSNLGPWA